MTEGLMTITRLEYCKQVLEFVKSESGGWPYPGALADASGWYKTKSVSDCAAWIRVEFMRRNAKKRK